MKYNNALNTHTSCAGLLFCCVKYQPFTLGVICNVKSKSVCDLKTLINSVNHRVRYIAEALTLGDVDHLQTFPTMEINWRC